MTRTSLADAGGLVAREVMHKRFSALPADASVADVRAWFATSEHKRMAFLAEDGRYAGSLTREDIGDHVDAARPAREFAAQGPTIAPDATALEGRELALRAGARRVPVVDADGILLGVVSVTADLVGFCGTS